MKKLELYWPVNPHAISQTFGLNGQWYRDHGINIAGHNGLDIPAKHGFAIRAAHGGTIVYAGEDGSGGIGVVIRTNEMYYDVNRRPSFWKTIYWHLINDIPVRVGQKVKIGQVIGYADNTGLSTGDHLHFGLKPVMPGESDWTWFNIEQTNGYLGAVNPWPYMSERSAEDTASILTLLTNALQTASAWITAYAARR